MIHQIEDFYLNQKEPFRSCYLALHDVIMNFDLEVSVRWRYKVPFFYYRDKPFCYLWYDKKVNEPYIGVVKGIHINHFMLEQGDRKTMKIFRVNPCEDIPVNAIYEVLSLAKDLYS